MIYEKFSPGPWKTQGRYVIPFDDGPSIGSATILKAPSLKKQPDFDAIGHANARLMAAAPDLLLAVARLLREHDALQMAENRTDDRWTAATFAREILNKLEG